MTEESYIHAMPKVELNVRLEGTIRKETLLMIAEQNDIPANIKNFSDWIDRLDNPDYDQLDDLIKTITGWLQQPDDLTRIVYDVGVALSKENVKYAEILVNPALFMLPGMTFDEFLNAINDGRDRAERGWGIQLRWIFTVSREEPRRADETMRWASGATGKKGGVVALGMVGPDDAQPVGQFERAFSAAQKKDVARVAQAGHPQGAEAILEVIEHLAPLRLIDAWGAVDAPDVIQILTEHNIPIVASMSRALCSGWVGSYTEYPLTSLLEQKAVILLSSDMPALFKSNLSDEYLAAVEHNGLTLADLDSMVLNAIQYSFLSAAEKAELSAEFTEAFDQLREEHIESQTDETA